MTDPRPLNRRGQHQVRRFCVRCPSTICVFLTGLPLNDLYRFDLAALVWTEVSGAAGALPVARSALGLTASSGTIFIFGGLDSSGTSKFLYQQLIMCNLILDYSTRAAWRPAFVQPNSTRVDRSYTSKRQHAFGSLQLRHGSSQC